MACTQPVTVESVLVIGVSSIILVILYAYVRKNYGGGVF